jgi:hypothetical protein
MQVSDCIHYVKNVTKFKTFYRSKFQLWYIIMRFSSWHHITLCYVEKSKNQLKSLKKHGKDIKFVCFANKIEIYFIHEHQLLIITCENIASGVHLVKYISILHAKQTNILYIVQCTSSYRHISIF